jgi:hypothetical protein
MSWDSNVFHARIHWLIPVPPATPCSWPVSIRDGEGREEFWSLVVIDQRASATAPLETDARIAFLVSSAPVEQLQPGARFEMIEGRKKKIAKVICGERATQTDPPHGRAS